MALAESIFAKLSAADSATAALAGSGSSCRVYPENAPPSVEKPYAIQSHIATQAEATHGEPVGSRFRLVQLACFATTHRAACALRDAIISDLDGETLDDGDSPTLEDERTGYEPAVELHRADADFLI